MARGCTRLQFVRAAAAGFGALVVSPGAFAQALRGVRGAGANGVRSFASRSDLRPPQLLVDVSGKGTTGGYLFVAPFAGAASAGAQSGPLIVDAGGEPVWFLPIRRETAMNFRVQSYRGKPVLTWYEGPVLNGYGGSYVIYDTSYRELKRVHAGNGLGGDLHEFLITSRDTALLTVYDETTADLSPVGGPTSGRVVEGIVQEVDLRTGKVVFQWHSLDHVALDESYVTEVTAAGNVDYFHLNSIGVDADGNLLVSARHTSTVYKLDRKSGKIIWRLGGKKTDFELGPGAAFHFQHDARAHADGTLSVFDNGAWAPDASAIDEPYSRPIRLRLDAAAMRAELVQVYEPSQPGQSIAMGNLQILPNGDAVVGWGTQPRFTQFARGGRVRVDLRFADGSITYRAFRFPWVGRPTTRPSMTVRSATGNAKDVYLSWNGATEVRHWQLRAGNTATSLRTIRTVARRGFETSVRLESAERWLGAAALDAQGRVLGTCAPHRT